MPRGIAMAGKLEPRAAWTAERCPMAATLSVVSTRTAFLLLREAFYGASRFEEFVRRAEISEPVAAARLRELVDHGLLAREPYQEPGQRTRHAYRLTDKGAELLPAMAALMEWGDRWALPEDGGPRVELRHTGCGERVGVELRCAAGHAVDGGELELAAQRRPRY